MRRIVGQVRELAMEVRCPRQAPSAVRQVAVVGGVETDRPLPGE